MIVSIFLDLWLVNLQNTRSITYMQGEITSKKDVLREVTNLLTNKMKFW